MSLSSWPAWLRTAAKLPLTALAAIIFLIEEVLWAGLGRLMAVLARLPAVARIETFLASLSPYPAMLAFLLPVAVILPFKFLALWLMAKGHLFAGLTVLLSAKLAGMAVWTRLYRLCHPALSTLGWFRQLEGAILRWRAWTHALLESFSLWRQLRELMRRIAAFWHQQLNQSR